MNDECNCGDPNCDCSEYNDEDYTIEFIADPEFDEAIQDGLGDDE